MKYHVISGAEEQCDFLYHLEIQHNWEDPVAIYMESWLSENFSLAEFRIKHDCGCKYALQMITSSLILIYMQEVLIIGWMLSWLHWKYDFT